MHRPAKEHLEEYLQAADSARPPRELDSHLRDCESCRAEVETMATQARLMRGLRSEEDVEAPPGFYARVMAAVEARQRASVFFAFTDPSFGRRLIYACFATIIILGSYLLYTERAVPFGDHSPVRLLVADTPGDRHVGADQQRDREMVLLSLASYRE